MGEGSGIIILETLARILKSDVKIYVEIAGFRCSADAFNAKRDYIAIAF
jgi:3-oxoacyl-(acyl-carrier-protein) synthase